MLTEVGAATWPTGGPRMKRPDASEDSEADVEKEKGELLLSRSKDCWLHEGCDVKSVEP